MGAIAHPTVPYLDAGIDAGAARDALRASGAIVLKRAAPLDTIYEIKSILEEWFDAAYRGTGPVFGTRTRRFSAVFNKALKTAELAGNPRTLGIVEPLLMGADAATPRCDCIQLCLTQAIAIEPGERAQVLHRDDGLYPFPHDFELMANVMWPLDPFTRENGATRVAPGSNHWPRDRAAGADELCFARAEPGDAIIWLGSTLHGGGENASNAIRRGVNFSYSLGWLGQAEKLLLSTPPHVVRALPDRVQKLIGYQVHRPNLGWIEGRDPMLWLQGETGELAPADDNVHPATAALLAARMAGAPRSSH
ncbi:MAG: phytanoyl-CoA dioxygenase family protein [Hyphomonadaceae bacterium]|nr:phytanoyl-CoA dioxygenase family protein [Hyphomonadaceae bacterium]